MDRSFKDKSKNRGMEGGKEELPSLFSSFHPSVWKRSIGEKVTQEYNEEPCKPGESLYLVSDSNWANIDSNKVSQLASQTVSQSATYTHCAGREGIKK